MAVFSHFEYVCIESTGRIFTFGSYASAATFAVAELSHRFNSKLSEYKVYMLSSLWINTLENLIQKLVKKLTRTQLLDRN